MAAVSVKRSIVHNSPSRRNVCKNKSEDSITYLILKSKGVCNSWLQQRLQQPEANYSWPVTLAPSPQPLPEKKNVQKKMYK